MASGGYITKTKAQSAIASCGTNQGPQAGKSRLNCYSDYLEKSSLVKAGSW
ncbi:unnamed protein product [marine sediment metagenome]|uniref:Uncharacterized protein n=1 Tax=marine sediment metagenome TaxID=412755 RepID=X1PK20_9ZZZZ